MIEFRGLHAIVTGGSRGIGAAVAAALTRKGARVTILGRNQAALKSRIESGEAHACLAVDVTDRLGLEKAIGTVLRQEAIDILVNNAGIAMSSPFIKTSDEDFERVLETNFTAAVRATRLVLPGMLERKFGRIINIGSTASLKGYPYVSAYVASKHAILGFTRSLAQELAKSGVTVNAVCPGFVDTDMVGEAAENISTKTGRGLESVRSEFTKMNPMGRFVEPAEVADAVCFLAQKTSEAINGTALTIAGGEI